MVYNRAVVCSFPTPLATATTEFIVIDIRVDFSGNDP